MNLKRYSFTKEEHLKSKNEISRIFKDGIFLFEKHLSTGYIESLEPQQIKHRIGISVPKKYVKRAVDRNRLKRQIRESYRLNRELLYSIEFKSYYNIMFVYRSSDLIQYTLLQDEMINLLKRIRD